MNQTTASTLTRTFEDDATIFLLLDNVSGDVDIHMDAAPGTAHVELRADRDVDFEPVELSCRDGRVRIDIPALLWPEGGGRGFSFALGPFTFSSGDSAGVDVTVHLPEGADLEAKTRSGDVTVHGTSGTTKVTTGSGDLRVDDSGPLKATSGSGDIGVGTCVTGAVTTGTGDVRIGACTGPGALQVRTGSGDIEAVSRVEETVIATGSGDVSVGLTSGTLNAKTGTGDVDVRVPHGIPVWLDLNTGLGDVSRRIDPVGPPEGGQDHLALTVRSGTGDIVVSH